MSIKKTLQRAYGSIPREVGMNMGDWVPTFRGLKYYWFVMIRKIRDIK